MKGTISLLLAIFVCCTASSALNFGGSQVNGPWIKPQRIGQCSWQACTTDKSVCFCMPSLFGPTTKCNPVKDPKQGVFPKCSDVIFG